MAINGLTLGSVNMKKQAKRTRLMMALAVAMPVWAWADEARILALEARIVQLEQQLNVLVKQLPDAVAAAPPTAKAAAVATSAPVAAIQDITITPSAALGTKFFASGFVKLDAMLTRTADGELADGGIARDLYVPGLTPVGGSAESVDIDSHIKFSRLIFGTDTVSDTHTVQTRIEMDFFGNGLGDERFNNASGLVVRHAYAQLDNRWLVGQTWSTFMDAATLPESSDLIGPTDGTVFMRQPMLRYSRGPFMFALENPETTLTPFRGGTRISSDDNFVPDLIGRYNHKFASGGTLGVASLLRQLRYDTNAPARGESATGLGLSVFGKLPMGSDDVRFALTVGEGVSRYLALNEDNDAVLDENAAIMPVRSVAGYVAYRHLFSPQLRSTVFFARGDYDNSALGGLLQTKMSQSLHFNLFYSPLPKWDVGAEVFYAERELESGARGNLWRLHTTVKYAF